MALELLAVLAAGAGIGYGWRKLLRGRRITVDQLLAPDLQVAFGVAEHEAKSRGHADLRPLHLLYGALQDEAFVAAIGRLGGEAAAMESYVLAALDRDKAPHDVDARQEAVRALGGAAAAAHAHKRTATVTDLWARLVRTSAAQAASAEAKIDAVALLFVLAHGMPEPTTELPERTDVHVVLRNDDYTTMEFVVDVLRDSFELSETDAIARMKETHDAGRTVVGRFKLAVAREKIAKVRARARASGFPLWVGVEDC